MKTIKVELSLQGIKELSKKIDNLKNDMKNIDKEISNDLADYTKTQIENNLNATRFKDGNDDVKVFKEELQDKIIVGMQGSQALYNEFGTGTQGELKSHPLKSNFGLKSYNSGKRIRHNNKSNSNASNLGIPAGGLYWTYKKDGIKFYTQGIPAGKQVFNAAMSLRNTKEQVIKKKVSDVLSKL